MQLPEKGVDINSHSTIRGVVHPNTEFAIELYRRLRKTKGNLFFSPYNISNALTMTCAGGAGKTKVQMARALHVPANEQALHESYKTLGTILGDAGNKTKNQLQIANSLWLQMGHPFQDAFLALIREYY